MITHSEALKESLTSIEKSPTQEIPARLAEVSRLQHVPDGIAQTKENTLEFLQHALSDVQEEHKRLDSEKAQLIFSLQDLPQDLVANIIGKN